MMTIALEIHKYFHTNSVAKDIAEDDNYFVLAVYCCQQKQMIDTIVTWPTRKNQTECTELVE